MPSANQPPSHQLQQQQLVLQLLLAEPFLRSVAGQVPATHSTLSQWVPSEWKENPSNIGSCTTVTREDCVEYSYQASRALIKTWHNLSSCFNAVFPPQEGDPHNT